MKHLLVLITLALLLSTVSVKAQTYEVGPNNELIIVKSKDSAQNPSRDVKTDLIVTKSGRKYSVWRSVRGKYYIIRKSRNTGKAYKQYLKIIEKTK